MKLTAPPLNADLAELVARWESDYFMSLPAPTEFKGHITIVGSRGTPRPYRRVLRLIAAIYYSLGYGMRSGHALGADVAGEQGILEHPAYCPATNGEAFQFMSVYLPWDGFDPISKKPDNFDELDYESELGALHLLPASHAPSHGYITISRRTPFHEKAFEMALSTHPAPEVIRHRHGMMALHTRNIYQVLGGDLESPAKAMWCFAKPKAGGVSGGTNTAYLLARGWDVPIFNLYEETTQLKVIEFLKTMIARFSFT